MSDDDLETFPCSFFRLSHHRSDYQWERCFTRTNRALHRSISFYNLIHSVLIVERFSDYASCLYHINTLKSAASRNWKQHLSSPISFFLSPPLLRMFLLVPLALPTVRFQ
jgi:hypothetical protein